MPLGARDWRIGSAVGLVSLLFYTGFTQARFKSAAIRRWPWECAAIAIYAATQLLYYANYRYWTGLWSAPGPRYLLPSCALLLLSLGAWLDLKHARLSHAALVSLAAVGGVAQLALLTADWQ